MFSNAALHASIPLPPACCVVFFVRIRELFRFFFKIPVEISVSFRFLPAVLLSAVLHRRIEAGSWVHCMSAPSCTVHVHHVVPLIRVVQAPDDCGAAVAFCCCCARSNQVDLVGRQKYHGLQL